MSISAAQADHFFKEIVTGNAVWTIRDAGGFPTSTNSSGKVTMPFWSRNSRAQRVIDTVPAYADFQPQRIDLGDFVSTWLPGLRRDGLAVGVNWSGQRATGYDISPDDAILRIERAVMP